MGPPILSEPPYRTGWANFAIRNRIKTIQRYAPAAVFPTNNAKPDQHFTLAESLYDEEEVKQKDTFKVGIVGAGVAGLFTAMIFDHLHTKFGLNVEYEILEANGEERVGGRLYSYYFPNPTGEKEPKVGPHDYYDVGAMRFPDNQVMDRTFQLFKELKMTRYEGDYDLKNPPKKGELIPYYMSGRNQPLLYNGVRVVKDGPDIKQTANKFNITGIQEEYQDEDAGVIIDKVIKVFLKKAADAPGGFWSYLLEHDHFSVREYLSQHEEGLNFNFKTIEFLETLNYGNRWYDQALSEMILENLDFGKPEDKMWCVEGGAQEIAYRMRGMLKLKPKEKPAILFGKDVTAISYVTAADENPGGYKEDEELFVIVKGEENPRRYDAVFNSAPLGAMQHMQLEGLNLNWNTKSAIRSLGYGASCKVGIRFRSLWWMDKDVTGLQIDKGGLAKTDLPIRCCVYPSYNIHDPINGAGVLLVSYTWSQEAERIGSLINEKSPENEDKLKALLIHDLARLHTKTREKNDKDEDYKKLHKIISDEYLSHYAHNWYADEHSVGAFAYFGPGQFKDMYPSITANTGQHIIIGEAASAHHAWVVGALESAVRGVYQFLFHHSKYNKAASNAAEAYAKDEVREPYGPLPRDLSYSDAPTPKETLSSQMKTNESDNTEGLQNGEDNAILAHSTTGELARWQVVFETIRLKQGGDTIVAKNIKVEDIPSILRPIEA